mmetsp:Transcript_39248/g.108121  ORF Transcript_39248/g.108121 Transcript_39248/m.108121 type:complete len:232 (-) Transcript_39248:413-1108(-)
MISATSGASNFVRAGTLALRGLPGRDPHFRCAHQLVRELSLQARDQLRVAVVARLKFDVAPDVPHHRLALFGKVRRLEHQNRPLHGGSLVQQCGGFAETGILQNLRDFGVQFGEVLGLWALSGFCGGPCSATLEALQNLPGGCSQTVGNSERVAKREGQASLGLKLRHEHLVCLRQFRQGGALRLFTALRRRCETPAAGDGVVHHALVLKPRASESSRLMAWVFFLTVMLE